MLVWCGFFVLLVFCLTTILHYHLCACFGELLGFGVGFRVYSLWYELSLGTVAAPVKLSQPSSWRRVPRDKPGLVSSRYQLLHLQMLSEKRRQGLLKSRRSPVIHNPFPRRLFVSLPNCTHNRILRHLRWNSLRPVLLAPWPICILGISINLLWGDTQPKP